MKRESHVHPLFECYVHGGRATSATVSRLIPSSAFDDPVGDYAHAPPLTREMGSTVRATSLKYTRRLQRNSVSGVPMARPPTTAAQRCSSIAHGARNSLAG
ncbi:hypothetical protein AWB69_06631 [Caballeronia udeis]|uniref:Uncharacterized protein n=1 Tax=Caballeronia udeis TaxID=1232866 RepID=A0A158IUF5_9BURK|nr:hypothetical protein [Caballeronia udeis]SAL59893.1 hypothetical protein AWB69_06631 [Caballeronia udeis]